MAMGAVGIHETSQKPAIPAQATLAYPKGHTPQASAAARMFLKRLMSIACLSIIGEVEKDTDVN